MFGSVYTKDVENIEDVIRRIDDGIDRVGDGAITQTKTVLVGERRSGGNFNFSPQSKSAEGIVGISDGKSPSELSTGAEKVRKHTHGATNTLTDAVNESKNEPSVDLTKKKSHFSLKTKEDNAKLTSYTKAEAVRFYCYKQQNPKGQLSGFVLFG